MSDLTEKFFNEEDIPEGLYYLKLKSGEVVIDEYPEIINDAYGEFERYGFKDSYIDNIEEVLAPVPSYEELQRLESDSIAKKEGEEIVAELKAENARLKEKINNISKQTKTLREKVRLWKNGLFCKTEKSALFYVEKVLTNIEEALK